MEYIKAGEEKERLGKMAFKTEELDTEGERPSGFRSIFGKGLL